MRCLYLEPVNGLPLFTEVPRMRILGSCASPCSHSYLSSFRNTAGLTSPALSLKGVALMSWRILLLDVVAVEEQSRSKEEK
jgi:hypothetical protein